MLPSLHYLFTDVDARFNKIPITRGFVLKIIAGLFIGVLCPLSLSAYGSGRMVVADSISRKPLSGASVFDRDGRFLGISGSNGRIPYVSDNSYPLTLRYLGYRETCVDSMLCDTILMAEIPTDLPEVVVESKAHKVLHMLGYVREYSTLTTYTDTVFLFREKMVDFMLTPDRNVKFQGWTKPRVLKSKSYYRFTDSNGLDSVSDESNYHFSWSDWISAVTSPRMPQRLCRSETSSDTIRGKYTPTEIWIRSGDRISVDVNVLADQSCRRWVHDIEGFFNDDLDFEIFKVRFSYENIAGDSILPIDLAGYSFNIESNGRGREMFQFNKRNEPFFVSTYTEVYIIDKEFITVKEARKWANGRLHADSLEILRPIDITPLQSSVEALVFRVDNIDKGGVRLGTPPDHRYVSPHFGRPNNNFNLGNRALSVLKDLLGISSYKFRKGQNSNWNDFRRKQMDKNRSRSVE